MEYVKTLVWPVASVVIAVILSAALVRGCAIRTGMWEQYSVACVQNGGQLVQGQCIR